MRKTPDVDPQWQRHTPVLTCCDIVSLIYHLRKKLQVIPLIPINTQEQRQEAHELEASLSYMLKTCLEKKVLERPGREKGREGINFCISEKTLYTITT